jgi:Asp-tRNA(Asn)/Glu-tRNA(Gln) amidotransferase A subunit family amidase
MLEAEAKEILEKAEKHKDLNGFTWINAERLLKEAQEMDTNDEALPLKGYFFAVKGRKDQNKASC